jgi:hypothetical protein
MNLVNSRTCIAVAFALAAGLAACDRKANTEVRTALAPDPSTQVIGVKPADPTGDPPGTTPVTANTTVITKQEEIAQKPQEGDNHSHSSLAQDNPQKGDTGKDPQQTPERTAK